MIHFVNVQISKLEQYMQVYVWYDTEEMETMGIYVSYYIGQQMWAEHGVGWKILTQKKNGSTLRLVKVQWSTCMSVWWNELEITLYITLVYKTMFARLEVHMFMLLNELLNKP